MSFWKKESTQKVLASLISILIGLVVGAIVVLIVGIFNKSISLKGAWEGIRLIFIGILSTGRDAKGALTWGFNPASIGCSTSARPDSISWARSPRSLSR